jgi:hypothetical protein
MGIKNHRNRMNRILTIGDVQYKLNRIVDNTVEDIHHIISRKQIHKFNVNNENNKIKMNRNKHVALNQLFWNNQDPKKQLEVMYNIWKTALSTWVRQELYTILNLPDDMFYNQELIKNGKKKKGKDI